MESSDSTRSDLPVRASTPVGTVAIDRFTTWLIVANILVFAVDQNVLHVWRNALGQVVRTTHLITELGEYSPALAIAHGQVWRFISFQFLHSGFMHIAMNMLALYFFGPLIESVLGSKRFVTFYLLCGIAGALAFSILAGVRAVGGDSALVGASAGIFGILVASARIAPEEQVLVFGILPMRLRPIAWIMIAIAVIRIAFNLSNAGGEAAHLGGAIMGWLLIQNPKWLAMRE